MPYRVQKTIQFQPGPFDEDNEPVEVYVPHNAEWTDLDEYNTPEEAHFEHLRKTANPNIIALDRSQKPVDGPIEDYWLQPEMGGKDCGKSHYALYRAFEVE